MECSRIKGIKNGFRIEISKEASFEEILENIKEKVNNTIELFRLKNELVIEIEEGNLTHDNKCILTKTLLEMLDYKAVITYITKKSIEQKKNEVKETIYHEGTLRSGQNIVSEGHIVVLGDVNPGAEISAAGNIVVLGQLKGIAHAGMEGNENATVSALLLQPTQLRIAGIITRAPEHEKKVDYSPEIARIKDGSIYTYPLYKVK
ncbi:MAG: septum site-determining protein MinC [Bacillota bacterium]|nr:septum site-determining protein MinC [Bacillota bacterium]